MKQKKIKNYLGRNFKKDRTPDKITPEKRSELMSKIRSQKTKFEDEFQTALSELIDEPFAVNVRRLPGTPDIVFEKQRVAIFLDSDFWHGWQYPRWKQNLKNDFWREKIEKNRWRDQTNTRKLRRMGWGVVRLWEHNIKKDPAGALSKVSRILR